MGEQRKLGEAFDRFAERLADQPGLPLTTGEGNTARVERDVVQVRGRIDYPSRFNYIHSLEALDRLARDAAECGRLRAERDEAVAQSEEDGLVMENAHRTALAAEALAGRLREQLDALTEAANAVVAFHAPPVKSDDEVSRPLVRLRAALGVETTKLPSVDDHPGYDGDK